MYKYDEDDFFQKAIIFASKAMDSCHNSKPVLVHSLRIAFKLYQNAYHINIVVAALLHDLIEDTSITENDILKEFGEEITSLVLSLTMNKDIVDYKEQYIYNFNQIRNSKEALLIRCMDIIDNAPYTIFAPEDVKIKVKEKQQYFKNISQALLSQECIWSDFEKAIK